MEVLLYLSATNDNFLLIHRHKKEYLILFIFNFLLYLILLNGEFLC